MTKHPKRFLELNNTNINSCYKANKDRVCSVCYAW